MATKAFERLPGPAALERIGLLIDASEGLRRRGGLRKALAWSNKLEAKGLGSEDAVVLEYFRANAWDKLRPRPSKDGEIHAWEDEATGHALFHLRRARSGNAFDTLHPLRQSEILTNLGSELSRIGRVVEALELWEAALIIEPRFWMARGNLGKGLSKYARQLYDDNQAAVVFYQAHVALSEASASAGQNPSFGFASAAANFDHERRWIESRVNIPAVSAMLAQSKVKEGHSRSEREYRKWCFRNRLFLDPFNDALVGSITPTDILVLPSYVTKLGDPPSLIAFFNQIKQEFVSARYLLYLALHARGVHYSDRRVVLPNTLDYPSHGLAVEQMRTAFRIAYSLFDKISFFLNEYFKVGIDPGAVDFRKVWKEQKGKSWVLRGKFRRSKNPPLRALFWLSKDLFDSKQGAIVEPDLRALRDIRVRLEHRYLKVHEIWPQPKIRSRRKDMFNDTLAYSVGRYDLEQKTLRQFKMARAAIIYLALAMHREEQHRAARRRSTRPLGGQMLPTIEDGWKR